MSPRRWPPAGPGSSDPLAEPAWCADLRAAIGDMGDALKFLAPTPVLASATYVLNAAGQAAEQYRAPYRALAVNSMSASTLTITSAPPQASAPGPGPGAGLVGPRGFAVVNMGPGYAWTIYGGTAGEQVSVQAFTRPQMAQGEAGPLAVAYPAASINGYGAVAVNAPGQLVAATPPLPGGLYQVTVYAYATGTVAAADADNIELLSGATVLAQMILINTATSPSGRNAAPFTARAAAGSTFSVQSITGGSGTATYRVEIIATQVGP